MTESALEPHDEKLAGTPDRLILNGLLTITLNVTPERFWLQVNESEELPVFNVAGNVMLRGFDAQAVLGPVA